MQAVQRLLEDRESGTLCSVSDPAKREGLRQSITAGAAIIAVGFVISKLVGLARSAILLGRFGAGDVSDVYLAAFKLPDLIFNILVLGAISSSFVPVFLEYWKNREGEREAWRVTNLTLNTLFTVVAVLAVLAIVFAPLIVPVLTPGFSPDKQAQTTSLTRVMLLATLLFAVSNVFSGVLTALRRFVYYSLAPILYNVGIIVGILVFEPWLGLPGLAWGVVFGALLHLLVQLPDVAAAGFRWRPAMDLRHTGVRKIVRLMIPRTLGLAMTQIDQTVSVVIASTLAAGSVTVLSAANDLQSFPINVFGVSLAVSVFPLFSQAFIDNDTPKFVEHFSRSVRRILLLIIPASVLILILRAHLVRIIFGFGRFDWTDTILTAQTLGIFSLSLFAQSLIPMLARSFYALQDTKTPVKISLVTVVIDIALAVYFSRLFGVFGIGLAFSIASIVNMLLLYVVLRVRVGPLDDERIAQSVGRILFATAAMAAVVWLMLRVLVGGVDQSTRLGLMLQGGIAGVAGVIAYLGTMALFAPDEVRLVRNWLRRLVRFGRPSSPKPPV